MKKNLILILLLAVQTFAQVEGNPENWCRNGLFAHDGKNYSIAKIKANKNERVYFLKDERNCPNDKNCLEKSYLVNNDEVLVSRTYGDYACSWYQSKKGYEVVGWLPVKKLDYQNYLLEEYDRWSGEWGFYDNTLRIKRVGKTDEYEVSGEAFWRGSKDNVHTGEIESKGILKDSIINLKEDECEIKLNLVVNYLIVADNMQCGGANVTFSGVYLKNQPARIFR